ncbi:MAG TPA: AzlC family ABC transporter permease [Actinomycetes bacterium]
MSTAVLPARSAAPLVGDRRALLDGARAMLPLLVAVAPFGLVIGVAVAESGAPQLAAWSTSWLVYAGSAQLAAIGLLAQGASAAAVVGTVAVINLRLALYGMTLAPHWRGTSWWWRAGAAYLLVDPSFVVGSQSYAGGRTARAAHLHFLGGAVVLWLGWLLVTAAGVTVGAVVPSALQLDFVGPLYLVALVVPAARTRAVRVAVMTGAAVAVAATAAPFHVGPAAGMVAGLLVGLGLLRRAS